MRAFRSTRSVVALIALTFVALAVAVIPARQADVALAQRQPVICPTATPYPYYSATDALWYCSATATPTVTELRRLAGVTAGTATASKALIVDANKAVDVLRTASLRIGTSGSETTVARTGTEINLLAQGVAAGYKLARGETALDGSNPTTAATGLTTIVACVVALKGTAAPGLGTSVVTFDWSAANVSFYAWAPTGAGDTTLIASTGTETVGWVCIGT